MIYSTMNQLKTALNGIVSIEGNKVKIVNSSRVKSELIDSLVYNAVFNVDTSIKESCKWLIRDTARALGIHLSSIQGLYEAAGRGEYSNTTVPAINIRGITYIVARSIFRAAIKHDTSALLFEIARSEIGYTDQKPSEYGAVVTGAAIREGFSGPLFLQGDHFQVNAKKYAAESEKELNTVRELIREAVTAGFFNIDIDTSTLVTLDKPTLDEQQRLNYELTASLTEFIRTLEPEGLTVSVGGEIGEVGKQNSTVEELRAYMNGYKRKLPQGLKGISKISVQTGTTHGGVPLPDGTVAKVKLDFNTLENLSKIARNDYGLSGAVQHGASTLPDEAFHRFPETGTAEVHLATGFQNMIYDHKNFPPALREKLYGYLREKCAGERKDGQTEEQFIYSTRKKGFGPFKKDMWDLGSDVLTEMGKDLQEKFEFLFTKLNVRDTGELVKKHIKVTELFIPVPDALK